MSNFPSMRFVSWNTELGVGVTFTSMPFRSKKPFSCATQIGQLKPPGKTIRLTVCRGGAAGGTADGCGESGARADWLPAQAASERPSARIETIFARCMRPPPFESGLLRIAVGQTVPHQLRGPPGPGGSGFGLLAAHARGLVGEPGAGERPRHLAHHDLLLLHQATVLRGGFLSFWSARNSAMSGREPHMQNDSGANGNCRGR